MEAIVERFHVWCPEKGLPGDEPHPLFFQAKRRIEDVSTKVDISGEPCTGGEDAVSFEEVLEPGDRHAPASRTPDLPHAQAAVPPRCWGAGGPQDCTQRESAS